MIVSLLHYDFISGTRGNGSTVVASGMCPGCLRRHNAELNRLAQGPLFEVQPRGGCCSCKLVLLVKLLSNLCVRQYKTPTLENPKRWRVNDDDPGSSSADGSHDSNKENKSPAENDLYVLVLGDVVRIKSCRMVPQLTVCQGKVTGYQNPFPSQVILADDPVVVDSGKVCLHLACPACLI